MNIGYQFETLQKDEITHTQIVRYAGASGDFNPIHTVVPFAQKAGMDDVIAHGLMVMGFIGQAIGDWVPVKDLAKFGVRFKAITKPGEKINVTGSILDETEDRWICEAKASNEIGEVKVQAKFEVRKK
ncbi:3-hydroxyacyl-ACP dehydratase [Sporosarcina sp. P13]|uniref:MaoC/PaaZ C-terminal domain-containing protein n=1 Tax=Sporosarcina sp. P13 TaxID=2048263 RepID=UPI000C1713C9|nr:MaoC/PaaZ C-terminal domain-containing protein [Sporosarcina sp. P13]PIC64916.1 3-hydroxyacyl-ACP dehydratase [Sporosarcina sp. P13]